MGRTVPPFLGEGVEVELRRVDGYWGCVEKMRSFETKLGFQTAAFKQGISDIHHRLASNIGAMRNHLQLTGFYTEQEIFELERIMKDSTEEGKIKKYQNVPPYPNILLMQDDQEAYELGVFTAIARTPEELLSWFLRARGREYVDSGFGAPLLLLRLIRGRIDHTPDGRETELVLLNTALAVSDTLESGGRPTKGMREVAKVASREYVRDYLKE